MTNEQTTDLERRLSESFRADGLPTAPTSLRTAIERVADEPVVSGRRSEAVRRSRSGWPLLGLAAVLLLGSAIAVALGSGGVTPRPESSPPVASASPAIGTARIVYTIGWTDTMPEDSAVLASIEAMVRGRVDAMGIVGSVVDRDASGHLFVDVPAGVPLDPVRQIVGQTGAVEFIPLGQTQVNPGETIDIRRFPPLFGSEAISGASAGTGQNGERVVTITLTPGPAAQFGTYTATHIGSYFAITFDRVVVSAPVIQDGIPGGNVEISQGGAAGGWDHVAADRFVAVLRNGPLPVTLTEVGVGPVTSLNPASSRVPVGTDGAVELRLTRTVSSFGCDTVVPPYRSFVVHLDPTATESVWAVTDAGTRLPILWGQSFAGRLGPWAVTDRTGRVVAVDRTVVLVPARTSTSLAGHFVCPGANEIDIFDAPPPA